MYTIENVDTGHTWTTPVKTEARLYAALRGWYVVYAGCTRAQPLHFFDII
jgi:hypothetical protein